MEINTESFEKKYEQYSLSIKWMEDIGLTVDSGRLSHYEKTIKDWCHVYKTATLAMSEEVSCDFISSIFEIHDLINVYKAFKNTPAQELPSIITKLEKAINGPINATTETEKTTTARNFLFEAMVAARMHVPKNNMSVIFNAPSDVGFKLDNYKIWIECKRVFSKKKIEKRTGEASKQLDRVIKKGIGSLHRGIVALDVSKTFHSGDKIFVQKNDTELQLAISKLADDFIKEYSHQWEKVYKRRHKKIIATLIRFSFMCSSEESNLLVYCSEWSLVPRNDISENDREILNKIALNVKNSPLIQ